MGKTSNAVKQKWNSNHYKQVKFSTKPETAAAFKAACAAEGSTMAGTLSEFILKYAGQTAGQSQSGRQSQPEVSVKTLKDRRKAAGFVHNIVTALLKAEENFIENAPKNLASSTRYEMAEERVSKLQELLDAIDEVYDE